MTTTIEYYCNIALSVHAPRVSLGRAYSTLKVSSFMDDVVVVWLFDVYWWSSDILFPLHNCHFYVFTLNYELLWLSIWRTTF